MPSGVESLGGSTAVMSSRRSRPWLKQVGLGDLPRKYPRRWMCGRTMTVMRAINLCQDEEWISRPRPVRCAVS